MRTCHTMKKTLLLVLLAAALSLHGQQIINLSGSWELSLGDSTHYDDYIMLPNSLVTAGKGEPVSVNTQWTGSLYDSSYYHNPFMERYRRDGDVKFPFFLTPRCHYVGMAWYRRHIYIPRSWRRERVMLYLERPHIETTVYINGRKVGHQTSLSVGHTYDVTSALRKGASNEIVIGVYNGIEGVGVGQDSHSVTDQTQGNWNGIAGRIELQARPKELNIERVRVYPDVKAKKVRVEVDLDNHVKGLRLLPQKFYYVRVKAETINSSDQHSVVSEWKEALRNHLKFELELGDRMQTWDEFHPAVYRLTVIAGDDVYETQFGMRELRAEGRQMFINDRPLFLRGTVENCCFPETGYPPTDEASWERIFRQCKTFGINHIRFHSYCPPEAAFNVADKIGIYLQPEGPSWPNHGVKLGVGQNIDSYLMDETRRMVETLGNHPSFCFLAAGNEPAGRWVAWGKEFNAYWQKTDPRRLYCTASVGGGWEWDEGSQYHVKGGARGLDWSRHTPQSADDYLADIRLPRNFKPTAEHPENTEPYISHEQGQWCAFPDLSETSQYTGAYRAGNFEIFRDLLRAGGMESEAHRFLMASGHLQTLAYKYEIERNLRTPDYTGFQLLGLNDYSGQGTALVGVLNVFWREKGYCDASLWREFCSPLVVLGRMPRFVFTQQDTLSVPVELYNAYRGALRPAPTSYAVIDIHGDTLQRGQLPATDHPLPVGKNNVLGTVCMPLSSLPAPAKYTLQLCFAGVVTNHYDFWVYDARPAAADTDEYVATTGIVVSDTLSDAVKQALTAGRTVLLTAAGHVRLGTDVRQDYLPVFWNTSWFKMKPPHTTGCVVRTEHPLFRHGFPTDDWANLNWWELLNRAQVMNLRELPAHYQPPIQPIDTWHVSRKLGMLIEARVGSGRLLMTTMDITHDLDRRHVARQMRRALLDYMQSTDFAPTLELSLEQIEHFYTREAPPVEMFTNESPDELKPKFAN